MRNIEDMAAVEVPRLIGEWLSEPPPTLAAGGPANGDVDFIIMVGGLRFLAEFKGLDRIASLEAATRRLRAAEAADPGGIGLVVVPYAGPTARAWLRERGLNWMDLAGNADIHATGLRIFVEGRANRYPTPGRPSTVFSPKAARISRAMLNEVDRWWSQVELIAHTALSAGFVSKVVGRMVADELLHRREGDGWVRPRAPSLLLDAWAQQYHFADHTVDRYHLAARSGPAALRTLAEGLTRAGTDWAATGLSAAWALTGHADFRLSSIYTRRPLADPESLGLRKVERGENVWVIQPRDEGVFDGVRTVNDVPCVSPVQLYLDLAAHPERSQEAAAHLRANLLRWRQE
jgi:hypothetical protein